MARGSPAEARLGTEEAPLTKLLASLSALALLTTGCGSTTRVAPEDAGGDAASGDGAVGALPYPIVDTAQARCYDDTSVVACPAAGAALHGQDAQFQGNAPIYVKSADGLTVRDAVTGLTWQRSPDVDGDGAPTKADKRNLAGAKARCASLASAKHGGFDDWRLPTIKELYSLILFTGTDPSALSGTDTSGLVPFLDTGAFTFAYGDTAAGERVIDSQYASSTVYVTKSATGADMIFGVNFADGRIKGYEATMPDGTEKTFFVQCVRGNPAYGKNDLADLGDGTIADRATGLVWSKADSGAAMTWSDALAWVAAKNAAKWLGHDDWRLPNAKELQSIVDYSRSPDATGSAAIDPLFQATEITNEAGKKDFGWYWASTTHATFDGHGSGVYLAFGRAGGWNKVPQSATCYSLLDVHGAGAQRSDPKRAEGASVIGQTCGGSTAYGLGPQGDAQRGKNFARLVRGGGSEGQADAGPLPDAGTSEVAPDAPPPMEGGAGPKSCTQQSDCDAAGACPGAKGCACTDTPSGKACVPKCSTSADCPQPPGATLVCGAGGLCVPG